MIYEKDMFDYSAGEPPTEYLTVLRALEVLQILCLASGDFTGNIYPNLDFAPIRLAYPYQHGENRAPDPRSYPFRR